MSNENNIIKFNDGKVLFSKEIIEYFESIRTEENSEWIDKYFEVLNDESNLNAVKYRKHHVIPCFGFKDETHKTRKETLSLANKIEYNIIKLSVYNHIIAHYYLWKIFNNEDSRRAVYLMYEKRNLDYLSENEIKEFAKIQEECAKENMTEEEKREWFKKWNEEHKDEIKERLKKRYEEHKEEKAKERAKHKKERSEYDKEYYQKNKEKKTKYDIEYRKTHKEEKRKKSKERYELKKDELRQKSREYYQENRERILKENAENAEEIREYNKKYKNQICIDPTNGTKCTLGVLLMRKKRNEEKYKDIIPQNHIIDKKSINA